MDNLLKKAHYKAEEFKGRRLVYVLLSIFVLFSLFGFGIGALFDIDLLSSNTASTKNEPSKETYYEGRILYVDPNYYPNDNISYALVNASNETIILLKGISASDVKLNVAEGLWGKVYGNITKTVDEKEEVLIVDRIVLNQAPPE